MKNSFRTKIAALILSALLPFAAIASPFIPSGENISLAATTTSQTVTFGTTAGKNATALIVYNSATTPAVVLCGNSSAITAVAPASGTIGGFLIPPGFSFEVIKGNSQYCAAVLTGGSGTIYFSSGTDND